MSAELSLAELARQITDRSAAGIAAGVNRMVRAGELAPGTRLPTVRKLAAELGTSPTTVNEAWRSLSRAGVLRTEGRNGSFVAEEPGRTRPARFWRLAGRTGRVEYDLSAGVPDPELLPRLPDRLDTPGGGSPGYLDPPVLPELEELLRQAWRPLWDPAAVTVVDGSLDAVDRLLSLLVRAGDRVVVEDPTFPPLLDLLENLGASVVGVGMDEHGMSPAELAAALAGNPAVVLLQPRAQNPTGASMDTRRAVELAAVLRHSPRTVVIEDDHIGAIAVAEQVSLAPHLPERTVHVRSFSKSHGPDLRLAAVGGPEEILTRLVARRSLGPAWSSRLLQRLLADMLADTECGQAVQHARHTYALRRQALCEELGRRGPEVSGVDGFNLWVPVHSERDTLITLAAHGIAASPGEPFRVRSTPDAAHVRLTSATVHPESAPWIADAVAEAQRARGNATTGR